MKNLKSFLCLVLVCVASLLPSAKSEEEFSILNQYKFQNTKTVEQKDHKIHLPINAIIKGVSFLVVGYLFFFNKSEVLSADNTPALLITFGQTPMVCDNADPRNTGYQMGQGIYMANKRFASPFRVLCFLIQELINKVNAASSDDKAFETFMEEKRFISGHKDTVIWQYMLWTVAWPILAILLTNLFVYFLVPSDKNMSSRGANRSFYKGNQLVNRASAGY